MSAPLLVALAASALWGTGDYLGGAASRRLAPLAVTFWVEVAGTIAVLGAVLFGLGGTPSGSDLWWGVAAGATGAAALTVFYRALAEGPMGVVAPLAAVVGACVPAVLGLSWGDPLGGWALVGLGVAIAAVGLISSSARDTSARVRPGVVLVTAAAGIGFGFYLVCIERPSTQAGLWPLVLARVVAAALLGSYGLATGVFGRGTVQDPAGVRGGALAGVFDGLGNACSMWALARGHLAVIGVLSSLYPAATVTLARVVDRERFTRVQLAGLAAALGAVVMIGVG